MSERKFHAGGAHCRQNEMDYSASGSCEGRFSRDVHRRAVELHDQAGNKQLRKDPRLERFEWVDNELVSKRVLNAERMCDDGN